MTDEITIYFSETEQAGQALRESASQFQDIYTRLENTYRALLDSGLQGAFSADFDARWHSITNQLRALDQEIDETGTDLLTVATWFRHLNTECAALFYSNLAQNVAIMPATGGALDPSTRLDTVNNSIAALRAIRQDMLQFTNGLEAPLNNPIVTLFGLHDDYERMRDQTQGQIQQLDGKIDQLEAERAQLEQAAKVPSVPSGFGALLEKDSPPVTPPPATSNRIIGNPDTLSQYAHNQRSNSGDGYACTLYAQASVLEAMGMNFADKLQQGKTLGKSEGWYTSTGSTPQGIGALLRANGVDVEEYRSLPDTTLDPLKADDMAMNQAKSKLESALDSGKYAVVNVVGREMGTGTELGTGTKHTDNFNGHTIWVTGIRKDDSGNPVGVIVNDSWGDDKKASQGVTVEYNYDKFMEAWRDHYNYQAAFATAPKQEANP